MTKPNNTSNYGIITYFLFLAAAIFLIMVLRITKDKNVQKKAPIEAVQYNPDVDTNFCYWRDYQIKEEYWLMLIDTIKYFEGMATQSYYHKGHRFIGYGHLCTGNESDSMDKYEVEAWLLNDLEIAIKEGYRLTGLKGGKLLCVADYLYQYGEPGFTKYKILEKIIAGYPTLQAECYYNGRFNSRMYQRRLFDLWLWKN